MIVGDFIISKLTFDTHILRGTVTSIGFEKPQEKKRVRPSTVFIYLITILGTIVIAFIIWTIGIQRILSIWWETYLPYSPYLISVPVLGGLIYLILIWQIKQKYLPHGMTVEEYISSVKPVGSGDHVPVTCPHCEETGYYFSPTYDFATTITCWKCGKLSSEVWCEKCGMGGDFVKDVGHNPTHWFCPGCKNKYPLPLGFYDNPIHLIPEEDLGRDVKDRKKVFEFKGKLSNVRGSFILLGSLGLGMSLVIPMVEGLQEALVMFDLYPVEPYDTLLNCFSAFFFLFATGWGFMLYTALMIKGVNQLRERRKQS